MLFNSFSCRLGSFSETFKIGIFDLTCTMHNYSFQVFRPHHRTSAASTRLPIFVKSDTRISDKTLSCRTDRGYFNSFAQTILQFSFGFEAAFTPQIIGAHKFSEIFVNPQICRAGGFTTYDHTVKAC